MAKFLHLQIHDVHQLDHMECKFFPEMESELIDCGEWEKVGCYLIFLRISRQPFPADYDKSSQRTRNI